MAFGPSAPGSSELSIQPQHDEVLDAAGTSLMEYVEDSGAVVQFDTGGIPDLSNLEITNSSEVHIGNKMYFQAPVTILYAKDTKNCPSNGTAAIEKIKENNEGYAFLSDPFTDTGGKNDASSTENLSDDEEDPSTNNTSFRIVSRIEWGAKSPLDGVNKISESPVPYVIIHHTATQHCFNQSQCAYFVRNIQDFHILTRDWLDIGYNFLIGGDGAVYEGRGWGKEGAHTRGFNARGVGIGFIGTFQITKAPPHQLVACKNLIEKGVNLGYIAKDYKLLAVRQLRSTISPGDQLYEELVTWPHWASAP